MLLGYEDGLVGNNRAGSQFPRPAPHELVLHEAMARRAQTACAAEFLQEAKAA